MQAATGAWALRVRVSAAGWPRGPQANPSPNPSPSSLTLTLTLTLTLALTLTLTSSSEPRLVPCVGGEGKGLLLRACRSAAFACMSSIRLARILLRSSSCEARGGGGGQAHAFAAEHDVCAGACVGGSSRSGFACGSSHRPAPPPPRAERRRRSCPPRPAPRRPSWLERVLVLVAVAKRRSTWRRVEGEGKHGTGLRPSTI